MNKLEIVFLFLKRILVRFLGEISRKKLAKHANVKNVEKEVECKMQVIK